MASVNGSLSLTSMNAGAKSTTGADPIASTSCPKLGPSPKSSPRTGKSAAKDGDKTSGVAGCPIGMAVEVPSMTPVGRRGADPPLPPSTSTILANNSSDPKSENLD
ncbi:hypothetical protein HN51_031052 [Arachis hypogaea]